MLTDEATRAAYDNVLKARKAHELRVRAMDSKRQKLKDRLEKGERRHEEERFNKVNEAGPSISSASTGASEAPVEPEEMEGPASFTL